MHYASCVMLRPTGPGPADEADTPRFLAVRVGDQVVVHPGRNADWWVGQVIHTEGGARSLSLIHI